MKKIHLLEEELTSDEPNENINATKSTLYRQKQEKEEIINTAEILQEEGQRILEDLSLVKLISCSNFGLLRMLFLFVYFNFFNIKKIQIKQ